MSDSERMARNTATAAAKIVWRKGVKPESADFLPTLFQEADAHEYWGLHVSRARMEELLVAEYKKQRGRALGGHVAAVGKRYRKMVMT